MCVSLFPPFSLLFSYACVFVFFCANTPRMPCKALRFKLRWKSDICKKKKSPPLLLFFFMKKNERYLKDYKWKDSSKAKEQKLITLILKAMNKYLELGAWEFAWVAEGVQKFLSPYLPLTFLKYFVFISFHCGYCGASETPNQVILKQISCAFWFKHKKKYVFWLLLLWSFF